MPGKNIVAMSSPKDRRKHPRLKIQAPIEFNAERSRILRSATADLSLGGCYLEMMFTFPVGTILEISLQLGHIVRARAIVVSRELRVGNGIQFINISTLDQQAIRNFIADANLQKMPQRKSES